MSDAPPAPSPAGPVLARTGNDTVVLLLVVGALLVIAGTGLLLGTHRLGERDDE